MLTRLRPGCSNGKVLKSFDTSGFIFNEVGYQAESELLEHSHENAIFCLVLQGTYTESHKKQETECKPSTLTFRPPRQPHKDRFHDQDVRVFTIEVSSQWMERLKQESIYLDRSIEFQGGPISRLSKRIVKEFHRVDAAARIVIEGLAIEMMAEAARHSAQKNQRAVPDWLEHVRDILHDRFSENLTLKQIASEVGVHPVHLASAFRQKCYRTVGEYIRELQIEYACREIAKGKTPLAVIALDAGFANQGHFSNTFKRLTGFTPTGYRNFSRRR